MMTLILSAAAAAAAATGCGNAATQADMNRCAASQFARADAALNAQWRRTLAVNRGRSGKLISAQRAWIAFRDAERESQTAGSIGGSIHPMDVAECRSREDSALALGQQPENLAADRWTAVVLLFHDHEWEEALLDWALRSPAFFIGAQGGAPARRARAARLAAIGYAPEQIARIASPIGTVGHSREPSALALSVLAGISGAYEIRHPHHG